MNPRTNRWVVAVARAALILGAILSRVIDPGIAGLSRLRMPRWSLPVVTGTLALSCLAVAYATNRFLFSMLMIILGASTLSLLAAVAVGRIATRGGSRRDGDVAMTIFASYGIGQIMPLFY